MSFGLDYNIPNQSSYNTTETEFEMFYQNILPNLSHIPENELTELKSILRNACLKYNNIKMSYKYQKIVKDLANNKDIRILRQDKGRGTVIMDSSKYIGKCLGLFDNEKFVKITDDPKKRIECKIQRCVRKIKNKISKTEYLQLYPTGSSPGKFYGTAKIHKLPNGGNITELPLGPIVSNIGTASYYLSTYLAKLLSPLSQSEYTIKNTKESVQDFKRLYVPKDNYKLGSFDLSSLFINVPLDYTINVILRRVYTQREIETNITKKELKDLLILCMKNVQFSFNGKLYLQKDGIAMGSLLGLVIAGTFMVELERNLLPTLSQYMTSWKRYVDDTISYVKVDCIEHVLNALNSFHANISFTYEQECNGMICFLVVLTMRKNNTIETNVYRKQTHNDIYLH